MVIALKSPYACVCVCLFASRDVSLDRGPTHRRGSSERLACPDFHDNSEIIKTGILCIRRQNVSFPPPRKFQDSMSVSEVEIFQSARKIGPKHLLVLFSAYNILC